VPVTVDFPSVTVLLRKERQAALALREQAAHTRQQAVPIRTRAQALQDQAQEYIVRLQQTWRLVSSGPPAGNGRR